MRGGAKKAKLRITIGSGTRISRIVEDVRIKSFDTTEFCEEFRQCGCMLSEMEGKKAEQNSILKRLVKKSLTFQMGWLNHW